MENNIEIGTVLHGKTDKNELEKHYKIVYNIVENKKGTISKQDSIQFISITSNCSDGNYKEVTRDDFTSNNTIRGFLNAKNTGRQTRVIIDQLIFEGKLKKCNYDALDNLIRKINELLDHVEQSRRRAENAEKKAAQATQAQEEANKQLKQAQEEGNLKMILGALVGVVVTTMSVFLLSNKNNNK
ncbi:MAG: hypothetical protein ACRC0X_03540 [Brevinema sp.]